MREPDNTSGTLEYNKTTMESVSVASPSGGGDDRNSGQQQQVSMKTLAEFQVIVSEDEWKTIMDERIKSKTTKGRGKGSEDSTKS